MMEIKKLTLGSLQTNAYIISKNNQVIIIDPGSDYHLIKQCISEDAKVLAVLLTHGHFDHIGAVNDVVAEYFCDIYLSEVEFPLIENPKLSFYDGVINYDITPLPEQLNIGDFKIKVHNTPGHTKGGVIFEIDDCLFTGDTLMNMSVGRMDLPTGDENDMRNSIEYIKSFTKDYQLFPGHGNNTTLYRQFSHNPYYK